MCIDYATEHYRIFQGMNTGCAFLVMIFLSVQHAYLGGKVMCKTTGVLYQEDTSNSFQSYLCANPFDGCKNWGGKLDEAACWKQSDFGDFMALPILIALLQLVVNAWCMFAYPKIQSKKASLVVTYIGRGLSSLPATLVFASSPWS